jgi:DNA-binding CsgD family transcriptional regulator
MEIGSEQQSEIAERPPGEPHLEDVVLSSLQTFVEVIRNLIIINGYSVFREAESGARQTLLAEGVDGGAAETHAIALAPWRARFANMTVPAEFRRATAGNLLELRFRFADTAFLLRLHRNFPVSTFTDTDIRLIVALLPLVTRLVVTKRQVAIADAAMKARSIALAEMTAQTGVGLVLVDADLRCAVISGIPQNPIIRVRAGRLTCAARQDELKLECTVRKSLGTKQTSQILTLFDGERPLRVLVRRSLCDQSLAALMLLVFEPGDIDPDLVRSLYCLSRSEAAVVTALCNGQSPKDAAAHLNMRTSTLRSYLKTVFAKLDVHRQSELARTIGVASAILRTPAKSLASKAVTRDHTTSTEGR